MKVFRLSFLVANFLVSCFRTAMFICHVLFIGVLAKYEGDHLNIIGLWVDYSISLVFGWIHNIRSQPK
jgi:hypothetical protein